jgi:hypothetical protein
VAGRDRFETENNNKHIANKKENNVSAYNTDTLLPLPEFVRVFRTKRQHTFGIRQPARQKRGIIGWAKVGVMSIEVWRHKRCWWVIDKNESAKRAVAALTSSQPQPEVVGFPSLTLVTAEGSIGDFNDPHEVGRGRE